MGHPIAKFTVEEKEKEKCKRKEKKQMRDCKSIGIPSIAPAPVVHLSTLERYSAHHNQSPSTTTIFQNTSLFGVVYIVKHHLCALWHQM